MHHLLAFLLFFLPALAGFNSAYPELEKHIKQRIKSGEVVGTAVAIVDHGKVTFMNTYGVSKKGEKALIDPDTVFQLGSISKPITASLVAIIQKQKKLDLKSPTIHHILSHTTGHSRAGFNEKIEAGWDRKRLLKLLSESKTRASHPFDYHNVAFSQIEEIIADKTKVSFETALKTHLFEPLKMTRATAGFSEFNKQKNRAWPHCEIKGLWKPCKKYSHTYHDAVISAGGMNGSIKDMASFLELWLGGFPTVAKLEDLNPFIEPVIEAPDALSWFTKLKKNELKSYYAHGWRILDLDGERIVFHGGFLSGFRNFVAFSSKKQLGIVILTNVESSFGKNTAIQFLRGDFNIVK